MPRQQRYNHMERAIAATFRLVPDPEQEEKGLDMGIPIDSNDIESMLNQYEQDVERTPASSGSMKSRKTAKMDAVHEIRVRLRNLVDGRMHPVKPKAN